MELSVIVCIHNTKVNLLRECLSSITRAVLPPIDYEVIVVDDGSDTDYEDTVKQYGAVYEKRERRGTLAARIRGIELARGEYVAFVDSDDTVGFNYYAPMIKRADEGFDIVFNSWAFRTEGTRYFCVKDDSVSGDIESDEPIRAFFRREGKQHSYYVLWNKVYRCSLLKSVAQKIAKESPPYPFCFSEDTLINLFAFSLAWRVGSVRSGYYYYRIHKGQTVNATSRKRLKHQIDCMSYTLKKCSEVADGDASLSAKVDAWRALMARSHLSRAREGKYFDLIPYIAEKYGVSERQAPMRNDGEVYEKVKLLPKNMESIEDALLSICNSRSVIRVRRPKRGGYGELLLRSLEFCGKETEYRRNYPSLPREKISPIKRLIFNSHLRRLAARLFKKGSRIRAFLKRFI